MAAICCNCSATAWVQLLAFSFPTARVVLPAAMSSTKASAAISQALSEYDVLARAVIAVVTRAGALSSKWRSEQPICTHTHTHGGNAVA